MTPYEAAFGKKPNLKGVQEWGEKVWVRVEKGDKLSGRVHKGHWLGIDEESKGVCVWWPDTKTVSIERNVYYCNISYFQPLHCPLQVAFLCLIVPFPLFLVPFSLFLVPFSLFLVPYPLFLVYCSLFHCPFLIVPLSHCPSYIVSIHIYT